MRLLPSILAAVTAYDALNFLQAHHKGLRRNDGDQDDDDEDEEEGSRNRHRHRSKSGMARQLDEMSESLKTGDSEGLQQLLNALASQSRHEDTNSIVKRDANGNLYEDFTHPKATAKAQEDLGIKPALDIPEKKGHIDTTKKKKEISEMNDNFQAQIQHFASMLPESDGQKVNDLLAAMASKDASKIDSIIGSPSPPEAEKKNKNTSIPAPLAPPKDKRRTKSEPKSEIHPPVLSHDVKTVSMPASPMGERAFKNAPPAPASPMLTPPNVATSATKMKKKVPNAVATPARTMVTPTSVDAPAKHATVAAAHTQATDTEKHPCPDRLNHPDHPCPSPEPKDFLHSITAEAHHLASELDTLDGEMKGSHEETGKLASLRAEKEKAETDKEKVEAEKDKAEEDKEKVEAQFTSEVTKRKKLETQLAKLKAEKTQEDVDLQDSKNKLKLAEGDKKKVEKKKTNDALENKLQTAQAAVQWKEDQIKALKMDLNADKKRIKLLKQDYEKQLAELRAIKRKGGVGTDAQLVEDHMPRHRRSRRWRGRGSRRHHGIQLDFPHAGRDKYPHAPDSMERKHMRVGHKVHHVQELNSQVEPYRQAPRKSNKINLEANTPTATEIKAEVATEETPVDTTVKVKETIAEKFEEPVHVAPGEELDEE